VVGKQLRLGKTVYAQEDSFKKDKGDIEEKPEVGVIRK
jgi:hypothetical protein